jgi:phage recombination protein Bet
MNNVVTMHKRGLMDFSGKQLDLIRRTVAAELNSDEFDMFISIARQNGLDPFKKQIYAIVYNKDKPDKRKVSFITGIGGYRAIAQRSGLYRPDEEAPRIVQDESLKSDINPLGIQHAEVTVYRYGPDGKWYPITGRAYWAEYAPIKDEWAQDDNGKWRPTGKTTLDTGGNWGKMPHVMLAKCAEADALRKGWPEDLGNLYVDAEMDRATTLDLTATEIVEQEQTARRQAALGGPNMITVMFEFSEGLQSIPSGQFVDRCINWIGKLEHASDIDGWAEYNRVALRQFWGTNPGDAIELKKTMEKRIAELKAKETA